MMKRSELRDYRPRNRGEREQLDDDKGGEPAPQPAFVARVNWLAV